MKKVAFNLNEDFTDDVEERMCEDLSNENLIEGEDFEFDLDFHPGLGYAPVIKILINKKALLVLVKYIDYIDDPESM